MFTEERVGDMLGSYLLEGLLGEGSMGRVWRAKHVKLGREAAIKVLRPEHVGNAPVINRFFDEARAVNRINHEHIVEIVDFVEERDPARVYCIMELLEGKSLAQTAEEAPLPTQAIVTVMQQLCGALAAAHALGIVHRDVKPDNIILVRRPGQPLFVKVLDFGVAKLGADLRCVTTTRTVQGTLLGTPLFMAPEQIVGDEVDARSDVYAVGCTLYWLLSGRLPFNSPHFGELSMQVVKEAPPPLPQHLPSGEKLPAGLADLALRCLAKRREERPQAMAAVLEGLERPDVAWRVKPKGVGRSLGLAAAATALLMAAGAWSFARDRGVKAEASGAEASGAAASSPVHAKAKVLKKAVPFDVDGTIDPFAP